MRFGLDVAQHQLSWRQICDRTLLAEQAGFDDAWVFDHFQPLYGDPKGPCLEGWSLLSALAAHTERIRLGTLVTGITYRHPAILAAQAVTVDHISDGRLELGLGAAWHAREHRALDFPFPSAGERIDRLAEAIEVMRLLMTGENVSFEGRHHQLRDAAYRPRPVQQPHPPIWIGGSGERKTLPLVARIADYWHGFGQPEQWARRSRLLDDLCDQAGRAPEEVGRSAGLSLSQPWEAVRRDVEDFAARGCTHLVVGWPHEGWDHLETFAEQHLPELRGY